MFVFLELSRLGTVFLACKNKHQFPTLKLSSLGHHPHDPGYGNSLRQPPKLWNQNCLFWIFLFSLFCSLSKTRLSDLRYLSVRILWQCKVKKRFLSIALAKDAHEHSVPCRNSHCGCWEPVRTLGRSCFSLSSPFIYEFLFHALGPFQVGLAFYPFLVVLVVLIFSYPPWQTLKRKIICLFLAFIPLVHTKKKLLYCSCSLLFGLAESNVNESFCSHKLFVS